jgi:hypothetical protein
MPEIFLDSGAFAFSKKRVFPPLRDYGEFCLRNHKLLYACANMDVIPHEPNEVEECARKTHDNMMELQAMGLKPVPVYHATENISWLQKYLEEGHPYIAIGALVGRRYSVRRRELDSCFSMIHRLHPKVKVHGFGVTDFDIVKLYPWHSVDSLSWHWPCIKSAVLIPSNDEMTAFTYAHFGPRHKHTISDQHQFTRETLEKRFNKLGFTVKQVMDDLYEGDRLSIRCFKLFAGQLGDRHASQAMDLFDEPVKMKASKDFRLFFTLSDAKTETRPNQILQQEKVTTVLVSYFELMKNGDGLLDGLYKLFG